MNNTNELKTCKNCNNKFTGNYCYFCGQTSNTNRIDFYYFIDEIQHLFLRFNNGFVFTLKKLIFNPGESIRNYVHGQRVNFYKPTTFIILLSVAHNYIEYYSNREPIIIEFILGIISGFDDNVIENSNWGYKILNWLINNYSYSVLLLIPILSLASYIAFRKSTYNFFEHLVLNTYTLGQITFFFILFFPVSYYASSEIKDYTQLFLAIFFTTWTYFNFFTDLKKYNRLLHTALSLILFTLFTILVGSFIILVALS